MHDHGHPVVPHPHVLVNVRRALVPLVAIRTLESRLFAAVVLHVGLQGLLVRVAGVTPGTVVGHPAGVPERSLFLLPVLPPRRVLHVRPEDLQQAGVVGRQGSAYEQERRRSRLAGRIVGRVELSGNERRATEQRNGWNNRGVEWRRESGGGGAMKIALIGPRNTSIFVILYTTAHTFDLLEGAEP